jgi:long-chain acyl-CoA synthetase
VIVATKLASTIASGVAVRSRAELIERAARAARAFAATGARPGGAVALLLRNDLPFLEAVFGAGFLGVQAVPLNWHFKAGEIEYILRDAGATHLVAHADLLRELGSAVPDGVVVLGVPTPADVADAYGVARERCVLAPGTVQWDDWLAEHEPLPRQRSATGGTMMYTSGTTGLPKGVRRAPVSDERRAEDARLRQRWFGNRPGLRTAIIGPLYHSVQLSYALAAVSAPGDVLLEPRFDPARLLALIAERRLTHLHLVPIMMARLARLPRAVRERYDVSSLEFVVHGSAPCAPEVKRELVDWLGPIVHEYYGTTECGMISRASSAEWCARPGTVGRAWSGRELRIYGPDHERLGPGREGEVHVSLGPMPDFTYHNAEEERAGLSRDGFVATGDVGYLDGDGYLYLCDRKRDVVISGGVNIHPAEIEAVLCSHPTVDDAAVFGVPDAMLGERLHGVVTLRPGAAADERELVEHVRGRLASYKAPRTIEFAARLPRDESGKLQRRRLRDPHWAALGRRI